ncbi:MULTISPECIES: YrhA family protein [Stenotrophomonas]|nr:MULTISPECIES: YrhA family protein [Stenotrophomonas]
MTCLERLELTSGDESRQCLPDTLAREIQPQQMQPSIEARLFKLRAALSKAEMYLGPSLGRSSIEALQSLALSTLGIALPESYLDFLSSHDGLAAEGAFLYSSIPRPYSDGGSALALVEMNLLARDQGFMDGYIELGESDMDCYVFDSGTGLYQVRDKVAFDNVYEEFASFDRLLSHILDLIEQRC